MLTRQAGTNTRRKYEALAVNSSAESATSALNPRLLAALVTIAILAALLACSEATPTPAPTGVTTATSLAATPSLPANTPEPEATATATATATTAPASKERPTATPTSPPTPEPTSTPAQDERLAPIVLQDSHSLQSALSEAELGCIGDDPEDLAFALRGSGPESPEEQARLLNCLHDETITRLFVAGFVPGPDPLSPETSQCVREAFDVIDPR